MADPASPVRLRQIALVSDNLARARDQIKKILDVPVIYEDPGVEQWGLKNFLIPLGGDIIEVVAPFKPGTTAGRLLDKRGEGGYMLIMQTHDAEARRKLIESKSQAKVIFSHPFSHSYPSWNGGDKDEGFCYQYQPKSVPGGLMPELDSHRPCRQNPTPLITRFSPWHPCGADYDRYVLKMKQSAHLHLLSCYVNLSASGSYQPKNAADRWSETFGIPKVRDDTLTFSNASVSFGQSSAESQEPEGLLFIIVGVDGRENVDAIASRARAAGRPCVDLKGRMIQIEMVGIKWLFVEMQDWSGRYRSLSKL